MAVKVAEAKAFRIVLALSVVAAALTDCPDEAGEDFQSVRSYALQLQQQGAKEEAIQCFHAAADLDKARPEPWLSIGEIYRASGLHPEAIKALRRCCDIASSGGRPVISLRCLPIGHMPSCLQ
jgi:tetratricopeptide (TPR) repeat protein